MKVWDLLVDSYDLYSCSEVFRCKLFVLDSLIVCVLWFDLILIMCLDKMRRSFIRLTVGL